MASNVDRVRKRNLSSDTTDSSENEGDGVSPTYNFYGQGGERTGSPKAKVPRQDNSNASGSDKPGGNYSAFAQKLMATMGYSEGKGLGRNEQGRVDIVESSKQRGRRGLGLQLEGLEADEDAKWLLDEEEEEFLVPEWIPECNLEPPALYELEKWSKIGERKEVIDNETNFCDPEVLKKMLEGKTVFDNLGEDEFLKARTRSNPHETIRGGIFQNRAAMKMAELDASFDFMFTNPKDERGQSVVSPHELLYFADICAGPGGFSEYILWRKKWLSKGFGLTLRVAEKASDFKLNAFLAGSPETFEPHYGVGGHRGDGDIFREDNLTEFRKFVVENSDGKGVHFVMADGGFSVEGQENIQEILSKQLYLCQFLCALSILRPGGHFLCKLFDVFTPFSVGCLYLMYRAFKHVCIFKPVTSRPANSERYIICKWKLADTNDIHDYMFDLNKQINKLKGSKRDVNEVVPLDVLTNDKEFFDYIYASNNFLGSRQSKSLLKLKIFVQNTSLTHPNQGEVRKLCLERWKVPDEVRAAVDRNNADDRYMQLIKDVQIDVAIDFLTEGSMKQSLENILDFKCVVAAGDRVFLLSLGRWHIFVWSPGNRSGPYWTRMEYPNFELPRDTLIEAELVSEFRGEGRGQRRLQAVHIIDAIYLGGDFVADKPLSERIKSIELFVKALSKPSRQDLTSIRCKKTYRLHEIHQVFDRMSIHQMKVRGEQRMCFDVSDDRYYVPVGLLFFKCVKEPWSLHHSRSQKRLYFFNCKTSESVFDSPGQDSVADYQYCLRHRLFWRWQEEQDPYTRRNERSNLGKDALLQFLQSRAEKIGLT